jgi:hypothetical protein
MNSHFEIEKIGMDESWWVTMDLSPAMHREFQERVFPLLEIEPQPDKQLSANRNVEPVYHYCFKLDDERATILRQAITVAVYGLNHQLN